MTHLCAEESEESYVSRAMGLSGRTRGPKWTQWSAGFHGNMDLEEDEIPDIEWDVA